MPGLSTVSQAASSPLSLIAGAAAVVQDQQIKGKLDALTGMVGQVQALSLVGAVASVAGIGVTVASMAILLRRMSTLDNGLKSIEEKIENLPRVWQDMEIHKILREVRNRLERLDEAQCRTRAGSAKADYETAHADLAKCFKHLQHGVKGMAAAPQIDEEIMRMILAGMAVSSAVQMKALVWLNDTAVARERSKAQAERVFEVSALMPQVQLSAKVRDGSAGAQRNASDLSDLRAVFATRPSFCARLLDMEVDGPSHLAQAEERDDAAVVLLPSD